MIICSVFALTAATHDFYETHSSVFVKVLWFKFLLGNYELSIAVYYSLIPTLSIGFL